MKDKSIKLNFEIAGRPGQDSHPTMILHGPGLSCEIGSYIGR